MLAKAQDEPIIAPKPVVRGVDVDESWIVIRREVGGFEVQVNVPTASYRGVTLRVSTGEPGYEVVLLHIDASLDVVLAHRTDDTDLIAIWRGYARDLSLPLLVEDADGRLQPVEPAASRMAWPRRAGSPLRHRRPRFLNRRKIGLPIGLAEALGAL